MTTTHRVLSTTLAARICVAGGLVGAAQGVTLLLVPPVVGEERFSYPFATTGHAIAQLTFAVQHLMLLAGVLALMRVAGPASRTVRGAVGTAAAGLALLTVVELYVATLGDAAVTDPRVALTGALYGVPTLLIGLGMLVGGIGIVRARLWAGWRRWSTLAVGAYVFAVLLPGLGSFVGGRIVLTVWMLLFAALGVTLLWAPR